MDRRADRARERCALAATRTTPRPRRVSAAIALVAISALAAACSTPSTAAAPARPHDRASTTTAVDVTTVSTSAPTTTSTTVAPRPTLPPLPIPTHALRIGSRTYDWVDTTRPTPAHGNYRARDRRELVTTIWYPAAGSSSKYVHRGAAPDTEAGPFPIVLFAHGHAGEPADYIDDIARWVSRGYVVVAPAFPLSHRRAPGEPSFADLPEQPGDLSFALTNVLELSRDPGSWLHGLVDARRVAAIGHSEGAWTVLALAADSCCRDPRVKAAVMFAGGMAPAFGHPFYTVASPPLLFAHALDDNVVPYAAGLSAYEAAPAPKYFVTVARGGHTGSYDATLSPTAATVMQITDEFLDHYAKGHTALKITSPHPLLATLNQRLVGG